MATKKTIRKPMQLEVGKKYRGSGMILAASRRCGFWVWSRRGFSYFSGCDQPRRQRRTACGSNKEPQHKAASTQKSDSATPSRFNWRAAGLRGPANLSAFLKRAPNCAKRGVPGFTTALKVLGVICVDAVYCGSQLQPNGCSALRPLRMQARM